MKQILLARLKAALFWLSAGLAAWLLHWLR